MKNIKYKVIVHNMDRTESKTKLFRTTAEICKFLGISSRTYQSFMLNRLKMTVPKTHFLNFVEIEKLTKEQRDKINKSEDTQTKEEMTESKLDDLFSQM